MTDEDQTLTPHISPFDAIRHADEYGNEYWSARELYKILGYTEWRNFNDNPPTADAVLDPQHPDHPVSVVGEGWAEWGTLFVVPKAGCYVVEVSWSTGHWSVTFAAGA